MSKIGPIRIVSVILVFLALATFAYLAVAQISTDTGATFTLVMEVPGQNNVEFSGAALSDDSRLEGRVGGIESVKLLSDGHLYILTPAIKTAREIDNPGIPGANSDSWPEWLSEPGRINPLSFAEATGQADDISDTVRIGQGGQVSATFEDGILKSIRFPNPDGDGSITYTYRNFESDSDLTASDFEVPDDYLTTD